MPGQMVEVHEKVKNYNQLSKFSDKLTFLNSEVRFIRDYLHPIMKVLVSSLFWLANFTNFFFFVISSSFYDLMAIWGSNYEEKMYKVFLDRLRSARSYKVFLIRMAAKLRENILSKNFDVWCIFDKWCIPRPSISIKNFGVVPLLVEELKGRRPIFRKKKSPEF